MPSLTFGIIAPCYTLSFDPGGAAHMHSQGGKDGHSQALD
jgi:hypothetical protein